jgi:hypothetical protein
MFRKSENYAAVENVAIAEFGKGTLSIVSSKGDGYEGILIKNSPKNEIGAIGVKSNDSNDYRPELAIVFHNVEGFNVFLEAVMQVKEEFAKKNLEGLGYSFETGV